MKSLTENLNLNLLELLSVLMPGAVCLTILNKIKAIHDAIALLIPAGDGWKDNFGYISAAYFIGYAIYVISTYMDEAFDCLKNKYALVDKKEADCQITYKKIRWWAKWIFPYLADTYKMMNHVVLMKQKHLGSCDHKPITDFQYCYRRLMMEEYPLMFAEVERYEATSKFFRSMIVVLVLSLFVFSNSVFFWTGLILFTVSLLVYLNRRQKALNVAFKNILVIEGVKGGAK